MNAIENAVNPANIGHKAAEAAGYIASKINTFKDWENASRLERMYFTRETLVELINEGNDMHDTLAELNRRIEAVEKEQQNPDRT